MNALRTWLAPCALVLAGALASAIDLRHTAADDVAQAARTFAETLDENGRKQGLLAFEHEARETWHFVPGERAGVKLAALSDEGRVAVHVLLRSALANQGYQKVAGILVLEEVLREIESTPERVAAHRDPGRYTIAIFGEPGAETWGWRFEGHHVSLNFTIVDGALASGTPLFLGSNPAVVKTGAKAGMKVLAAEETLARQLLAALGDEALAKAVSAERPPADILNGPGKDDLGAARGIAAKDMGAEARVLLVALIAEYVGNLRSDVAEQELARIRGDALAGVHFQWIGSVDPGGAHYYRVQGADFVLEYDTVQNGQNHVHTVWRRTGGDFGRSALAAHYASAHPPR